MSANQDSAASIAADMRQLADDIEAGRAIVGQSVWRSYADRVEAVGTGNVAKLRDALEQAKVAILAAKEKMGVENPIILEIIDEALAAPERNCDRFNSGDPRKDAADAWDAHDEWVASYEDKGKTPPLNEFGWLFAPARSPSGSPTRSGWRNPEKKQRRPKAAAAVTVARR